MSDMEGRIEAQRELHGRISRTWENLKKVGLAKITIELIRSTLPLLEAKWAKFEEQHYELMRDFRAQLEKHDYVTSDFVSVVELAYSQQRAHLLQAEKHLLASAPPPPGKAEQAPHRASLPRIELPKFSGHFEDWPSFRDLFASLVGEDSLLSKTEKLHYLKTCVKGNAECLIRDLPSTAESYERAWKLLTEHYENKRLLVRSYLAAFNSLPKMKSDCAADLRRIFHGMLSTVGALEGIGRPITSCEDLFVFLVVERLDLKTRREWEHSLGKTSDPPGYSVLREFLQEQLRTQDALQEVQGGCGGASKPAPRTVRVARTASTRPAKAESNRACPMCKGDHYLAACELFIRISPKERREVARRYGRCCNCLGRHEVSACNSEKTCFRCSGKHHTSLHDAFVPALRADAPAFSGQNQTVHVAKQAPSGGASVLLATARVLVCDKDGVEHSVRALIDSGSETSLISESLAQRLRLPRTPTAVAIYGIGGQHSGHARGRVSLTVKARDGQFCVMVSSLILPRLSAYSGAVPCASTAWPHVRGLSLADPTYFAKDPVELLLGADAYATVAMDGPRRGGPQEPIAQKTKLGWILLGSVGSGGQDLAITALQCSCQEDLSAALRKFWEWEEPLSVPLPLTLADEECERLFALTTERVVGGRYQVRLPTRAHLPDLTGTRRVAERMCGAMDRRFVRDAVLKEQYVAFMSEYEKLGHMSQVAPFDASSGNRVCYLPHHGVRKQSEAEGKLRVVFNGSASVQSGASLNSSLLAGPNLLPPLPDVVLRWRRHRFAFVADIEKMYRQILVHPDDRDLQRILWPAADGGPLEEFRLNTVTYGLACAPFLAIRVTRQLAIDEGEKYKAGAKALERDTYVDDVLTGADSLESGARLQRELAAICTAGGFRLRKWAANHSGLLHGVSEEDRALSSSVADLPVAQQSVLGLRWNPERDDLSVVVRTQPTPGVTKREIVSGTARLFDPLGWLAPIVIRAKLIIQATWLQQLDWDAPVADEEAQGWKRLQEELPLLEDVRVPRWFQGAGPGATVEVHGFADASERAVAAVVYLRYVEGGGSSVSLALAKTKVAPLQRISLPRLELSAADLLSKVAVRVKEAMQLASAKTVLWSDSTVTLAWIHGHPTRWTTFVANRVAEIHRRDPTAQWRHVPGKVNPADCASRGLFPSELRDHPLWWQGPSFLQEDEALWPQSSSPHGDDDLPEQRALRCLAAKLPDDEPEELCRFSSLLRLTRVTAWMRRWIKRPSRAATSQVLQPEELHEALWSCIRLAQGVAFPNDIRDVKQGRPVATTSGLRTLTPFLDDDGLLRVGGRLKNSVLAADQRHPIILPPKSHLTLLILRSAHLRTLHGGIQTTLAAVRQRFWVPRGRQLIKGVLRQCPTCVRLRAATPQPRMGSLPAPRTTPHRPFLHTGVDFAGPYQIRTTRGRGQKSHKGFVAVFVCFSTRAVHLEVASDYSSAAFLAAFRRFVARRGLCEVMYSDCGTNFVGADSELRALFRHASPEARSIAGQLANDGVRWRFNPPSAPHFGGLWEAAVKSTKHHLRRVIGEQTLTFEELSTLLAEIEACLNSRPLQALSDDPEDLEALTPGHFIIGGPLNGIPEPSLLDASSSRLSRWRLLQQLRDHWWQRWTKEYLQALTPLPKWWRSSGGLTDGQLCLVKTETLPPTRWPLARVLRQFPGTDGEVRVAEVRTTKGVLTRPVVKLVPLPGSES